MKLFDLIENGKHKILAEVDGERFEAHLIDVDTREDLGEINEFVAKAAEEGSKLSLLDNGAGGIKIIKGEEELSVGVTCVDEEGNTHTFIPSGADLAPLASYIAQIGDVKYETLKEAIEAASKSDKVELIANTAEDITIAKGKTINLVIKKGVTLTNNSSHTITNNGTLTIAGDGTIDNVTHGKGDIVNNYGAKAILQGNVKYVRSREAGTSKGAGGNSWYNIQNYGDMTVKGKVNITSTGSFSSLIRNGEGNIDEYATLNIEAGNFSGGLNTIKNSEFGKLYVKGGTFSNTTQATVLNWGEAEISGGTLNSTDKATDAIITGIWVEEGKYTTAGDARISDGIFNGSISLKANPEKEEGSYGKAGTTTITGGTFIEDVTKYVADGYEVVKDGDNYKVVAK